jgi:hypothetical protein
MATVRKDKTTGELVISNTPTEKTAPEVVTLNIYQKLHCAKQSMGKVIKNATNPHFKRSYADINSIIETVEPILMDCGLILMQPVKDDKVYTIIIDIENGDRFESYMTLPPITDAQKLGSAVTYFRRYTLVSLLSLQAVDDDGETASKAPKAKPTLDGERWDKALNAVKAGKFTPEQIKEMYNLTKEQEAQL